MSQFEQASGVKAEGQEHSWEAVQAGNALSLPARGCSWRSGSMATVQAEVFACVCVNARVHPCHRTWKCLC